ncbi:hypothetical protein B0T10DRAFT_557801 [Thelonectria olida]|uniref:Uncharacterized protein n=1 Tax=Thelonectria olida TaxID=1576542 RepID=A0A9P8WCF8_9HYPO|nr:hypothetical protein B0T10DRAFT_557801 [Thelonectria olida]
MQLSTNVRTLCSRVQTLIRPRRRKDKQQRGSVQISAPFNLKREPVSLPGISEDEIAMLRDKAAASRIGIADPASPLLPPHTPHSPYSTSSLFSHPFRAPPLLTAHTTTSTESLP